MSIHFSNISDELSKVTSEGRAARDGLYRRSIKRVLEITLILLTSAITVPVVALMALLVALDGGAPFFRQRRVGMNGMIFDIWKLRTMVPDAEERLQAYLAANPTARAEWDATQKLKDDPRVTRIGRFLRKTSLDELPQLWNVVRGEMSLVGPRPMMISQRALYPGTAYYALRPGITGFWQVSDRNDCEFAQRARFDAAYDSQISFAVDVGILAKTVRVVLRATGY
jgi:lipopolysaccharide/colanic/teichoic acid biosynthesis glycosyltransferase